MLRKCIVKKAEKKCMSLKSNTIHMQAQPLI